jgi:hypothetical protein
MKISIASASTAAAAIALVLAGAAPAVAKGKNPSRLKAPAAKQDCRQQTQCGRKAKADKPTDGAPELGGK